MVQNDVEFELRIEHFESNGIMSIWIDNEPLTLKDSEGEVLDFVGTIEQL